MSALTLSLRTLMAQTIDMSPLTPDLLNGKSAQEIAVMELVTGNRKVKVADVFEVAGSDTTNIVIRNATNKLNRIGQGMSVGAITVEGDAGAYVGIGMQNGRILVAGNADAWTGSGMAGGEIQVKGNAGDFLGAAIPGDKQGMVGGSIVVEGNAGDRAGDHMRRGMLLIAGDAGDYCGSRMLAGTLAVRGKTGAGVGLGLKRGTLLLAHPPKLSATFNDCGTHNLSFLTLLHRQFRATGGLKGQFAHGGDRVRDRKSVV